MVCLNCGEAIEECRGCSTWVHSGSGLTVCESADVARHLNIAEWAGPWSAHPTREDTA